VVLRLRPACTLRGTAVYENGRAALGLMRFRSADGTDVMLGLKEGRFEANQLPPGRARLEFGLPRYENAYDVELSPDHETELELHLKGKRP
jgi:hypothetical protein